MKRAAREAMPSPKAIRCVWGMVIVAALAGSAVSQTDDPAEQLAEGQRLRDQGRYAEARTLFSGLLRNSRNSASDRWFTGVVLDNLAVDEQEAGNYAEAEIAFNKALTYLSACAA